jgi:hypothetical protein
VRGADGKVGFEFAPRAGKTAAPAAKKETAAEPARKAAPTRPRAKRAAGRAKPRARKAA